MIRGTTPTFKLTLSDETVDLTQAENVYVTFRQPGCRDGFQSLTKTGTDLEVSANEVSVFLSQKETLQFHDGDLELQLNWVYEDNTRACSDIVTIQVDPNLINKVLK